MKSFKHYLMESVRTYKYKIKIAGETPKNFNEMFSYNLQKFDPVKIGEPKKTPVQKDPYGFPGLKDQSITIIDVEFKYPATEPMIRQVARLLNVDENMVRMIQADYDDSINKETEDYAKQASPLLTSPYEEIPGAKQAAEDYSKSYLPNIKKQHEESKDQVDSPYAAPKTKAAFDPFVPYLAKENKSPMTTIYRQPKPQTGSMKK